MGTHSENEKELVKTVQKFFGTAKVQSCSSQGTDVVCDVAFSIPDSGGLIKKDVCTFPDDSFGFTCKEK